MPEYHVMTRQVTTRWYRIEAPHQSAVIDMLDSSHEIDFEQEQVEEEEVQSMHEKRAVSD